MANTDNLTYHSFYETYPPISQLSHNSVYQLYIILQTHDLRPFTAL